MKETAVICNKCGKVIDKMDLECNGFSISHILGYGSIYDGDTLEFDLCSSCQNEFITYLIETCKISPIQEAC